MLGIRCCDRFGAHPPSRFRHTGEVATTVLLPQVVDMCSKKTSSLTGGPVMVVGAGGIYDGRG